MRSLVVFAILATLISPAIADNREYKTGPFTKVCRSERDLSEAVLAGRDRDWLNRINCGIARPGLRVVRIEPDEDTKSTRLMPWRIRVFPPEGGSFAFYAMPYDLVR